jgi:hypothetical protein
LSGGAIGGSAIRRSGLLSARTKKRKEEKKMVENSMITQKGYPETLWAECAETVVRCERCGGEIDTDKPYYKYEENTIRTPYKCDLCAGCVERDMIEYFTEMPLKEKMEWLTEFEIA